MVRKSTLFLVLAFVTAAVAVAGFGPPLVNYQGVLRNASGEPLDGTFDMVFRFHNDLTAGAEILVDAHLASGTGAVVVEGGVFNVSLGSGDVSDGWGPGTYSSLPPVFWDHTNVWMSIEIEGEVLSPRVYLRSVPYASNADAAYFSNISALADAATVADDANTVGGKPASQLLDTTSSDQTKAGSLTAQDFIAGFGFSISGTGALVGTGSTLVLAATGLTVNDLSLRADSGEPEDGSILLQEQGPIEIWAGNGVVDLYSGDTASRIGYFDASQFDVPGEIHMDGGILLMSEAGVDRNQDIRFRDGGLANGERFQWDDPADRFEVSNDFHVFGQLTADIKNFVQNHPERPDLEIVYTAMEGDEATVYTRGVARLEGGVAEVALGETFAFVANPEIGLSAHLTPRGRSAALYVESLTPERLVVRTDDGASDVEFDFVVLGLRAGYEDFPVVRKKRAEAFLPPDDWFEPEFADEPELRRHTAGRRHRAMAGAPRSTGATARLVAAVGQRPLGYDYPVGSDRSVAEMARDAEEAPSPFVRTRPDRASRPAPATAVATEAPPARRRPTMAEGVAYLATSSERLEPGDVVVIDPFGEGDLVLGRRAADPAVFGVVRADPGPEVDPDGRVAVASHGVVPCKVDAAYGAIRPGDLLTTSETAGHARRATDGAPGTILGKALEPFEVGTGTIRVLVTLR